MKALRKLTNGRRADFVLECSASENGVISFISLWGNPNTINADYISLYQLSISGAWSWSGRQLLQI